MGFFSDLFGKSKKTDFGAIYPDPPRLVLEDYSKYLSQWDDLINEYDKIKTGESMFDAVKFIYEPQKAELERLFGIGAPGYPGTGDGDIFARSGSIPRILQQANLTGTLDAGTSNFIRAQEENDLNRQLASLFGSAKQTQRDDFFNALGKLETLYPERFEIKNIPNYLNYFNDTNQYNVLTQRNAATEADRLMRAAATQQQLSDLFGTLFSTSSGGGSGLSSLFGGGSGGGGSVAGGVWSTIGNKVGSLLSNYYGNNADSLNQRANLFGTSNGYSVPQGGGFNLGNMFSSLFGGNTTSNPLPSNVVTTSYNGQPAYGIRNYGQIPVNGTQPILNQPTTSQQASLVNSNTPGASKSGGMDFLSLLTKALGTYGGIA